MNEQQRYEKHLAEKFQQLPLPDVEPNWQQMKALPDKEMPRGGGYWRWRTAFGILLLMLGGTWFFISQNESGSLAGADIQKHDDSASKVSPPNTSERSSPEKQDPARDELSDVSKSSPATSTDQQADLNSKTIDKNLLKNNQTSAGNDKSESSRKIERAAGEVPGENAGSAEAPAPVHRNSNNKTPVAFDKKSAQAREATADANRPGANQPRDAAPLQVQRPTEKETSPVKNSIVAYDPQNAVSDFRIDESIGDSIGRNYPMMFPGTNLENQKSQKVTGKTKSAKMSAIESVQDRTLAIGVSLPLGFPLGDQKPGAYNVNARPNTISDFLPVPHMQYHINSKVYLQTELQLLNPQFIRPVLLYETKTDVPTANTVYYNSVYARKLYYFNLPLGIHYSPFPHFYLGTGLQFSSFISGVALHEKTSYVLGSGSPNLVSQRYEKFRNDSISNRIDNSEFRLMLDANYYWKQFTVGLRYNQALSNYVSFRLNNISPLFQDKNKSLQFYLRYNLWEDYKRRAKR